MDSGLSILIRPGLDSDHNFIIATWLNNYLSNGNMIYKPGKRIYYDNHEPRIKSLLGTCQTLVATTEEAQDQIIGYLVQDAKTVHFCYVKNLFRKMGIAKELLKHSKGRSYYSQHTSMSRFISKGLQYDPYQF